MRRRDRQRLLESSHHHAAESHDDRASAVTSNADESMPVTMRTLHAQQLEVIEVDRGKLVDRVVEFVSSSVVIRALTRAGNAGSIVSCVLGGGAIAFVEFQDTRFFALMDSDIPHLVCAPKRTLPEDFKRLVESTLKVKCQPVVSMMGTIAMDAATMSRVWRAAAAIPSAALVEVKSEPAVQTDPAASLDHRTNGAGAFFELSSAFDGHHRVSASQSHLNAAVDEFVRMVNQNADVRALSHSLRAATAALREHSPAGRLAGAVPYVHVVTQMLSVLCHGGQETVAALEDEASNAVILATSALVSCGMEIVTSREAAASIVETVVSIFARAVTAKRKPSRSVSLALCASCALLSGSSDDLLFSTFESALPEPIQRGAAVLCAVETASDVTGLVHEAMRPHRFESPHEVARHLLALSSGRREQPAWDPPVVDTPVPGMVESLVGGAGAILSTGTAHLNDAATHEPRPEVLFAPGVDAQELHRRTLMVLTELVRSMCACIALLHASAGAQPHGSGALPLLLRWFTSLTSLLRRSSMLCGILGMQVATGLSSNVVPHAVTSSLVHAATSVVLVKAFLAPSTGTSVSKLGFIAHQWLVKLGIAAGPASAGVIVATFDEYARTSFCAAGVCKETLGHAWSEVVTVFDGLAASVPSPSPMLRMWSEVIAVANTFRDHACLPFERASDEHTGHRLAAIVATPAAIEQRYRGASEPFVDAEIYLKETSWEGADGKFDSAAPQRLFLSLSAAADEAATADSVDALDGGGGSGGGGNVPAATFSRFGITSLDLAAIGPALFYVWPSFMRDATDDRPRALSEQCLKLADALRAANGPAAIARFFAAFAATALARADASRVGRRQQTVESARVIAKAYSDNLSLWLDGHLAMHFAASVEGRSAGTQQDNDSGVVGSSQLPHSIRAGQPSARAGKASVLDHVTMAYT